MRKSLIVILFLFVSVSAYGATLTVGPGKTYSTIQAAVNAANCGDTIDIYNGTYNESLTLNHTCGSGDPLTVRAALGQNSVIMDGGNADKRAAYFDSGDKNIIFGTGITIQNYQKSGTYDGSVELDGCSYITIDGITMYGDGGNPQRCPGTFSDACEHNAVYLKKCPNSVVQNSEIYGKPVSSPTSTTGADVALKNESNNLATFQDNVLHGARHHVFHMLGSNDIVFQRNYGYCTENTYRDLPFRFKEGERFTVRYNVLVCSGYDAYSVANFYGRDYDERHKIYNNVLYGGGKSTDGGALRLYNKQNDFEIYNNIFIPDNGVCIESDSATGQSHKLDNNIFNCSRTVDNKNNSKFNFAPDGSDNNKYNVDPQLFASGSKPSPFYQIKTNSPARDAGLTIQGYVVGTDYNGKRVPVNGAVDIGAFEYIDGSNVSDSPPEPPTLISIE